MKIEKGWIGHLWKISKIQLISKTRNRGSAKKTMNTFHRKVMEAHHCILAKARNNLYTSFGVFQARHQGGGWTIFVVGGRIYLWENFVDLHCGFLVDCILLMVIIQASHGRQRNLRAHYCLMELSPTICIWRPLSLEWPIFRYFREKRFFSLLIPRKLWVTMK